MKNKETGKLGEDFACKYLLNNNYLILATNHREKFDEIDIIARHPGRALIFCEVKTINDFGGFSHGFMPEDNLSLAKRKKMIRASGVFLARHPGLVLGSAGWQMDFIAIVLKERKVFELRHYENI
jgi:putative endonuclease